ncbi:MAG: UrcA family protein [Hyphomonadaceae bacterium]|nr:UrcA family protein [Hyphomonadaceae bacterium]
MRYRDTLIVAAALLATPVMAGAASAEPRQRTVDYSDLDLSDARDAATLIERLDRASRAVCGGNPRNDPNYRASRHFVIEAFEECRAYAMSQAMAEFESPAVQHAYAQSGLNRVREG